MSRCPAQSGTRIRTVGRAFVAALAILALALSAAQAAERVDLELVLAADGSGSMDAAEFSLQRAGYAEAITHPDVLGAILSGYSQAIAIAYVEWAAPTSVHTIVDWMVIRDAASAAVFADRLILAPRVAGGYNSISAAIVHAASLIESNDFRAARKIIDISGDGPQINGPPLALVRAAALDLDITINALVIKSPGGTYRGPGGIPLETHYARDVIGGFGAFVETAETRAQFAEAIRRKLVLEIAATPAAPAARALAAVGGAPAPPQ